MTRYITRIRVFVLQWIIAKCIAKIFRFYFFLSSSVFLFTLHTHVMKWKMFENKKRKLNKYYTRVSIIKEYVKKKIVNQMWIVTPYYFFFLYDSYKFACLCLIFCGVFCCNLHFKSNILTFLICLYELLYLKKKVMTSHI